MRELRKRHSEEQLFRLVGKTSPRIFMDTRLYVKVRFPQALKSDTLENDHEYIGIYRRKNLIELTPFKN